MPARSLSAEIRALRDKGMPARQAVAASLNMARKGDFGRAEKRTAGRPPRRSR